jgi:hypothetical protein
VLALGLRNLVLALTDKGRAWRAEAEEMPAGCGAAGHAAVPGVAREAGPAATVA